MYSSQDALIAGIIGGSLVAMVVLVIAFYVVYIIAFWKIFTKAGEAGWKSIIPFYNVYIQFKLTWDTKYFWALLVMALAVGALSNGNPDGIILVCLGIIEICACILAVMATYYLSKSFGHGAGYTVGLIFLGWLFVLILGFGSSEYVANTTKNELEE